jgi:hypothetical protein
MPQPGAHGRGLLGEVRDAVTPRAFLLVVGVGLLQLAFIASYIGAFHRPTPYQVPVAVTAPTAAVATRAAAQLNALPGDPLNATVTPDAQAGLGKLRDRSVYGLLEVSPATTTDHLVVASAAGPATVTAVTAVLGQAETRAGRRLSVTDIVPPASGDNHGLSAFYLVIGWMIGGYLVASLLGLSSGARSANLNRITIRLVAIALYAVVTSLLGTLIVGPWLHALPNDILGLWGIGILVIFAAGAFTTALMTIAGIIGIGIAILIFVIGGNPSAGGVYGWPLLPAFWRAIGPWLPPGAGTDAVRSSAYFGNAGMTRDLLVLGGYALAGLVVTFVTLMLTGHRHRPVHAAPAGTVAPASAGPASGGPASAGRAPAGPAPASQTTSVLPLFEREARGGKGPSSD